MTSNILSFSRLRCIINTRIVVCVFYAIAWLPMHVYYLLANLRSDLLFLDSGYYAVMFVVTWWW